MPKLKNKPTLWEQQGIVHIGLILILLAGLVAGVYLVQHPQIFKPKASGGKVWLIDNSGNNLPQKDEGVYEVPGQEIRIYINQPTVWSPPRPQGRLPNLVTAAYAQSSQCDGAVYSCSDIKCPDNSTAPGTGCYEKGGDLNNRYRTECLRNCPASSTTGGTGSSGTTTNTGTNTGTTTDTSTPTITGASWDPDGSYLKISGSGFGNSQGTVYYSRGGSEQIPSRSVSSWSAGLVKIGAEIPLGATRSVDNMISEGNYLKVCKTDGKCSGYWSPIPKREFKVDIPTAPKDAPQGQGAPAAPTQPEVAEVTQEIRISSVVDYVKKDGLCEGSEDPAKHCMSLTEDNPDQRYTFAALVTKGYVDWWLANTTEEQIVFVGFISNKGTNYTESIKVRIVRPQPTARPTPAGGGAPPSAKTILDTLAGSPDVICIEGAAYYNDKSAVEPVKTEYWCRCGEDENGFRIIQIVDPDNPTKELADTTSPCKSPTKPASPSPGGPKPSCREVGVCVKSSDAGIGYISESNFRCSGVDSSNLYSCLPEYPICLTGTSCKPSIFGGGGVSTPTPTPPAVSPTPSIFPSPAVSPTPSPSPALSPPPGQGSPGQPVAGRINVQNNTDKQVTVQKINVEISYGIDILGLRLFPELINIMTDDRGFRGPVVLDPNKFIELIPGAICTEGEGNQYKEKVVRVDYIMANAPYIARGKYQCGEGSGTVIIP